MDRQTKNDTENNQWDEGKKAPYFSVIIPTYNRPAMLASAVETVLDQSFQDFEIIVVDDHSTADVQSVIDTFNDSRIKCVKNRNRKGANGARNTGIEESRGSWIKFLDDDDTWFTTMLLAIREKIKNNKQFGLIYTDYERYDFNKKRVVPYNKPRKPEGWVFSDLTYINFVGGYSFVAIRKDIFQESGLLDESLPAEQDWDLFLRIARVTQFGYVDKILGYYRRDNSDNISKNETKRVVGLVSLYQKNKDEIVKRPKSNLRMSYRIAKASFLSNDWGTFLRFYPRTIFGIGKSGHNIINLTKKLAVLKLRKYIK